MTSLRGPGKRNFNAVSHKPKLTGTDWIELNWCARWFMGYCIKISLPRAPQWRHRSPGKQEYTLKRSLWYKTWGLTRVKKGTCSTFQFFNGWNYAHFDKISRLLFWNTYLCQNVCGFSSCWFTDLGCWFVFFIFIIITTITQSFFNPLGPEICPNI